MKVVVLGAGVVGVTSAWYLAAAGHEVVVLDRQSAPGMETSFANGGQISVSHAEPWANPTAPLKILQWLGREDAPLLFRLRADPAQWAWAARFLFECLPWRTRFNTAQTFALALHSRAQLQQLRAETGLEYQQNTRGILHLYTEPRLLARAAREAVRLRERGFDAQLLTPEACVALEPALAHAQATLCGGTYTASDESGDAFAFTQSLARLCAARGVRFEWNATVQRLRVAQGRIGGVQVLADGSVLERTADAYVLAMGSYSRPLLAPLGMSLPVYPVKGYSVTLQLADGDIAPQISLTDHERKIVFSRLGNRLRVAGTAELNGYDTTISAPRCEALISRAHELFPYAGRTAKPQLWAGLRPATPSNLPCIGRTRLPNLFVNAGHGTLGWTMACGSGQALAELVSGRAPLVEFRFLRSA
jgi:D-amino-acid dehydrogenase